MKVALKYCGGCDPAYDRVEFVERVKAASGGSIDWVALDNPDHEAVLLVCGCARACPTEELSFSRPLVCLTQDDMTPEEVVSLLFERGKT